MAAKGNVMPEGKMREEFEEWCKGFHVGSSLERYEDDPGVYLDWNVQCVWRAWQASRAALVIELPPQWYDAREDGDIMDANAVIAAVEAAGVRVKE